MTVTNDYPVEARAGVPLISLPDVPWGAEAWVLVELSIPAGFTPEPGMPLLQAGVTGVTLDQAPIGFPEVALKLDALSPDMWQALTGNPLVRSRHAEVGASRLLEQARAAAGVGDWDRVQAVIDEAGRRFGDQPWVQQVLASLDEIAQQRNQASFSKESALLGAQDALAGGSEGRAAPRRATGVGRAEVPAQGRQAGEEGRAARGAVRRSARRRLHQASCQSPSFANSGHTRTSWPASATRYSVSTLEGWTCTLRPPTRDGAGSSR